MHTASLQESENLQNSIVLTMANLIESRDGTTGGHTRRTCGYISYLLDKLLYQNDGQESLTEEEAQLIQKAAPLYDIGKITISDIILKKPGKLTGEEFEMVKTHTTAGGELILQNMNHIAGDEFLRLAFNMATYHHERYDGNGYPSGLEGKAIPLCARIVTIADVFDALVSPTHYKKPRSFQEAEEIMLQQSRGQFDPELLELFFENPEELQFLMKDLSSDQIRYLPVGDALRSWGNQLEYYVTMLCLFPQEVEEKSEQMSLCMQNRDWDNFAIYASSLKNSAYGIGAYPLSEFLKKMQFAAQDGDEAFLHQNYEKLDGLLEYTMEALQEYLGALK